MLRVGWLIGYAMDEEAGQKDGKMEKAGTEEEACSAIAGRSAASCLIEDDANGGVTAYFTFQAAGRVDWNQGIQTSIIQLAKLHECQQQ